MWKGWVRWFKKMVHKSNKLNDITIILQSVKHNVPIQLLHLHSNLVIKDMSE